MGLVDDQPFLLQAEQRLADGPAADIQHAGEVVLDQPAPRRQPPGQNRLPNGIDHVVHKDAALARLEGLFRMTHSGCLQLTAALA